MKVRPGKPKTRKPISIKVRVRADVPVRGRVLIKVDRWKKKVVRLHRGKATLRLKKGLRPGKHKVRVVYLGSDTVKRSSDSARFWVRRR